MGRGNDKTRDGQVYDSPASMRPRLMGRGNLRYLTCMQITLDASMRPRLMGRGNLSRRRTGLAR